MHCFHAVAYCTHLVALSFVKRLLDVIDIDGSLAKQALVLGSSTSLVHRAELLLQAHLVRAVTSML